MRKKKKVQSKKVRSKKSQSKKVDKPFWSVLGLILTISFVGIILISGNNNLTGNAAVQTIAYMKAGSELFFEVKVDGVKEITINFLEDVKGAVIQVEELESINWDFDGTVYSTFKVSSEDKSKIGDWKFQLKLEEEKLNELGLSKGDVKLYLNNKELGTKMLDTKSTITENGHVYYTATSSDIGEFVIGKAAEKVEPVPEEIIPEAPVVEKVPEPIIEELEEVVEEPVPLVGKAIEQEPEGESFFSKIIDFFKGLFG